MIINNLININEMMSMKCKNLSRLLFRGQSRTCLLDFRDCTLHLDNLLPPEGESESHLLSDEMPLPLSFIAPIKMHRWPFNTSWSFISGWKFSFICIFIPQPFSVLHRPHYSQLWLVVSQFVFMLVVQWSYSVGSLRQGCLVTSSKADCFYFMSVSLAF